MTLRILLAGLPLLAIAPLGAFAQSSSTYIPGVTFQTDNPNYLKPNPFYFEGRVDWNLLKLAQPVNAWDFIQHGIYNQDDLRDKEAAIADYQMSISLNSLANGTCQIVSAPIPSSGNLTPAPCMFTVRLRLAGLLKDTDPKQAISLYSEVLKIDPLRLGVNAAIGETYASMAQYPQAVAAYQAELALSPVTPLETQLTADQANNAHVHWALADIYSKLDRPSDQASELNQYLLATKWHSDTYPWRIALAQKRVQQIQQAMKAAKKQ